MPMEYSEKLHVFLSVLIVVIVAINTVVWFARLFSHSNIVLIN